MVNSTNYSSVSINSENYGISVETTDVLLLENSDKLLLENGTDAILLDLLGINSTNYSSSSVPSTDYS